MKITGKIMKINNKIKQCDVKDETKKTLLEDRINGHQSSINALNEEIFVIAQGF